MANDKFDDTEEGLKPEVSDSAVRARNRTVMLTPEITGQVRARLSRESENNEPFTLPLPDGDFVSTRKSPESGIRSLLAGPSGIEATENGQHAPSIGKNGSTPDYLSNDSYSNFVSQRRDTIALGSSNINKQELETSLPYARVNSGVEGAYQNDPDHSPSLPSSKDYIEWTKIAPVTGFLVSFDEDPNGSIFIIRAGRLIVTSELPNGGNFLMLQDASVSPMHAVLRIAEQAEMQVLDNLSEFGTTIIRQGSAEEISLSGDKAVLNHGDKVRFGKRTFNVCLVGK